MQRGAKGAVIGGVSAVVVAAVGFGGYSLYQNTAGDAGTAAHGAAAPKKTGPPSADEVRGTADAFLTAWASGDVQKAASLTDDPAAAAGQLDAYRSGLHITGLTLTPGPPRTAPAPAASAGGAAGGQATDAAPSQVPFTVKAQIDYDEQKTAWDYASALTVVRDSGTGNAVVKWAPTVLHPQLAPGQSLQAAVSSPAPVAVLDRDGKPLKPADHPSLGPVISELQSRYGTKLSGVPGTVVRVRNADGRPGPTLRVLTVPKAGRPLPTTIDSTLQSAAEKAVTTKGPDAAVVAIQPSTGAILAIANNPGNGYDKAVMGDYAPGSTFKVITASTVLETGKLKPSSPLDCPKNISVGGLTFHNVDNMEIKQATMANDFAASCNTAFISTGSFVPDGAVESEARDVFGIGLDWNVGVASFDGKVPPATTSAKAMTFIGQGTVQMNPLTMASVAATARTGSFHQPYLVPQSVDNRAFAHAARPLPATVDAELRSMMKLTAQAGTAQPAVGSLSGDVGAKTGTAEVDGQSKPNSWFLAYRDDVAAAAVVPKSGEGYKFAGPIVAAILAAAG